MKRPCCHPKWIKVPDFNKANYQGTKEYITMKVPCRHCVNCNYNYQREWMFRLIAENQTSEFSAFVTLTYDDVNLKSLDKKELQLFVRMLRQRLNRLCDKYDLPHVNISYYGVGEYGRKFNRPHYHIMLFHLPVHDLSILWSEIVKIWHKGFVYVQPVTMKNIGYVTKYITKYDYREHEVSPFVLCLLSLPWV